MPWNITRDGSKHCVVKEDGEVVSTYNTRKEAVTGLQLLYKANGEEMNEQEIVQKYYPYYGVTSFDELEAMEEMTEKQDQIYDLLFKFHLMAENILETPVMLIEKVDALQLLWSELVVRISAPLEKSAYDEETDSNEEDSKNVKKWDVELIVKGQNEKQLVYGVVLAPGAVDSQGDLTPPDEIEKAAHQFFIDSRIIDYQHAEFMSPDQAIPVESYIAPSDITTEDGKTIAKGSWVMVTYVPDSKVWDEIKKGKLLSYSITGYGTRTPKS